MYDVKVQTSTLTEILETEAAVMANFEFLSHAADVDMDEDDELCDDLDESQEMEEQDEMRTTKRKPCRPKVFYLPRSTTRFG